MAIAFTFRSSVHTTTGAASHATTSAFTPAAHSLMIAAVRCTGKATAPTGVATTSAGYTFAEIYNNGSGSNYFGLWCADSGATPGNDTVTSTWAATAGESGAHVSVIEITGADMTGTAAQAIVANATTTTGTSATASITFAAASHVNNRPLAAYAIISNAAMTERSLWTELDEGNYTTPSDAMQVQARSDAFETTGTATFTATTWSCLGVEIKAAVVASGQTSFVGTIPL